LAELGGAFCCPKGGEKGGGENERSLEKGGIEGVEKVVFEEE